MFVDRIKVFAQAGDGGRGCVSFRREKFVPRGGPDGGDGGRGGDVILRADVHTDNLSNLFYEPIIKAKSGAHGQGKKKHGRGAPPKVVKVPVGTVVYRAAAPVRERVRRSCNDWRSSLTAGRCCACSARRGRRHPIADLTHDGEEFILCQGGRRREGQRPFQKFARIARRSNTPKAKKASRGTSSSSFGRWPTPRSVGYPNAGKSTLLGKISAAHPKVAPYPFTTLHPVVGVIDFDGYRRASIADIPGLIEGAHRNVGLGHDFLRHITRCRILLFVLDIAGSEGRHPIEDLQNLRREIDLYDPRLSERPWYVVANKMDLPEAAENLRALEAAISRAWRSSRFPRSNRDGIDGADGRGWSAGFSQTEESPDENAAETAEVAAVE